MPRHVSGRTDVDTAGRLARSRTEAGKTQLDAARACSVSVETIQNWEGGRSEPRCSDLKTLCALYGVSPNALLGITFGGLPERAPDSVQAS